jgi:hypothetical protein
VWDCVVLQHRLPTSGKPQEEGGLKSKDDLLYNAEKCVLLCVLW